jgi:hypothetical protein
MTQTAVEWFQEQIILIVNGKCELSEIEVFNKASEMFKEQIIQAAQYEPFLGDLPRTEGEHYFEKTFKKD